MTFLSLSLSIYTSGHCSWIFLGPSKKDYKMNSSFWSFSCILGSGLAKNFSAPSLYSTSIQMSKCVHTHILVSEDKGKQKYEKKPTENYRKYRKSVQISSKSA